MSNPRMTGVVRHPSLWAASGYQEIHKPRDRYGIIDLECLSQTLGFESVSAFQKQHCQWIDEALADNALEREAKWSRSIAVGSEAFVNQVSDSLCPKIGKRQASADGDSFVVREPSVSYSGHFDSKMGLLRPENTRPWNLSL